MSPYAQAALAVIGLASSLTTGLFMFAYFLGKLRGDLDRTREQMTDHASMLLNHGHRLEKTEEAMRGIWTERRQAP